MSANLHFCDSCPAQSMGSPSTNSLNQKSQNNSLFSPFLSINMSLIYSLLSISSKSITIFHFDLGLQQSNQISALHLQSIPESYSSKTQFCSHNLTIIYILCCPDLPSDIAGVKLDLLSRNCRLFNLCPILCQSSCTTQSPVT